MVYQLKIAGDKIKKENFGSKDKYRIPIMILKGGSYNKYQIKILFDYIFKKE